MNARAWLVVVLGAVSGCVQNPEDCASAGNCGDGRDARIMVAAFPLEAQQQTAPAPLAGLTLAVPEGTVHVESDELAGAVELLVTSATTYEFVAQAPGFADLPFTVTTPEIGDRPGRPYSVSVSRVLWMSRSP